LVTTEGLYIAPISNAKFALLDSYQSFVDSRALMDLQLADEDYRSLEVIEDEKIILKRECNIFLSQLKIFSLLENEFLRTKDFKNNDLILFTSNGQVYKPKCVKIDNIILVDSELCYKDIPIKFYVSGFWKNGFLTNDRIIRAVSSLIPCSNLPKFINIPLYNQTISYYQGISRLTNNINVIYESFDFYDDIKYKNYTHIDGLVNGVDIIGQIHNISIINENGNQWMVISDENSKQEGFGYIFMRIKDWFGDWVWYLIKRVIWVLSAILFLYVSVRLLIIWCKYRSKRKNKSQVVVKYRKSQDEELVEIKPSKKNKKRLETSEALSSNLIESNTSINTMSIIKNEK
jgi:hypothetical protein